MKSLASCISAEVSFVPISKVDPLMMGCVSRMGETSGLLHFGKQTQQYPRPVFIFCYAASPSPVSSSGLESRRVPSEGQKYARPRQPCPGGNRCWDERRPAEAGPSLARRLPGGAARGARPGAPRGGRLHDAGHLARGG